MGQRGNPGMKEIDRLKQENTVIKLALSRSQRDLKRAQTKNSIIQALADNLIIEPMKPLPRARPKEKKHVTTEDLVLHLSDGHVDHVIEKESTGGLEEYNFEIATARAETLIDGLIKWVSKLEDHKFTRLWILAYGDHVNGEIHNSIEVSHWKNAFKSAEACGKLHALMFRDLAAVFDDIQVIYLPGNHGRRSLKKDYERPQNNWDYLVARFAKLSCANMSNVRFHIPNSFSLALNINGHGFYIAHGDDIRAWNGIPFYGIQRKTQRLSALSSVTKQDLKYFCFGHFHQPSTLSNLAGEVIINGAWLATTPFVYESFSGYTEPCQILHGVHKDYGITWRIKLYMKGKTKPERYKICVD